MGFPMCVSTFGNLRITGYVRLPEAYRSLSRPSSAPDAKAFTMRPLYLDLSSQFFKVFAFNITKNISWLLLIFEVIYINSCAIFKEQNFQL